MPLFNTKMMPLSAARSAIRGRPPLGLGRALGKSGAMMAQSPSLTNGVLMPQSTIQQSVLLGAVSAEESSFQ